MNREDLLRARQTRVPITRDRRADKRPGDGVGRVACEVGVGWAEAIAVARTRTWWPRVRSESPTRSQGWWCWALRPEGEGDA